ncbi:MAG: hypothetical protein DWQ05_11505 [Calditrichaeota bacterium]|nr:MAG: hypothetical protein DWQ05_11505 [Calditrichota bacterium]
MLLPENQISILVEITDEDELDSIEVKWSASAGTFVSSSKTGAIWQASKTPGIYAIRVEGIDLKRQSGEDSLLVSVGNRAPNILTLTPENSAVVLGNLASFATTASDSDAHVLDYSWKASAGEIQQENENSIVWLAPQEPAYCQIYLEVADAFGGIAHDTAHVVVYREAGSAWVADTGNNRVLKLSADGDVLITKTGFISPNKIKIDAIRRSTWILDFALRNLTLLNLEGENKAVFEDLGGPADLSVMQVNGNIWVVETDSNRVVEISNDGKNLVRQFLGFNHPSAIGLDQRSGGIYIANTGNHEIVMLQTNTPNKYDIKTTDTFHTTFREFDTPVALDVDLHTQEVWIVDNFLESVMTIKEDQLFNIGVSGLRLPKSVAIDNTTRTAWIADTGNGRIVKINKNGIISEVTGFLLPHAIAVDPNDGNLWVADTENDRIVKCAPNGEKLFTVYGFSSPQGITINPGQ